MFVPPENYSYFNFKISECLNSNGYFEMGLNVGTFVGSPGE